MINAPFHTGLTQEGLSPPIGDWKMWIVKLWALQLENFSKRRIILKLKSIPKNSAKQIFKYVEKLILDWIRPVLKYYFFNWSQTQLIFSSVTRTPNSELCGWFSNISKRTLFQKILEECFRNIWNLFAVICKKENQECTSGDYYYCFNSLAIRLRS